MKNKTYLKIVGLVAVSLLVIASALFFPFERILRQTNEQPSNANKAANVNTDGKKSPAANKDVIPFSPEFLEANSPPTQDSSGETPTGQIIVRLFISVLLAAILAFRPRKNVHLFERNLYVAQTQILLAVVAAALMMIVGDNAARAFAIFAAVSLVRFRTNIRDPKEVTVLLICLALGLAAGVGRWDLGLILCLFVLVLLSILEYKEPDQAVRPMELTVKTRNVDSTQAALKQIFDLYHLETEIRQIDAPDEANPVGCIVHYLNLRLSLSTDYLSNQIINLDRDNIDSIQWAQKKSATDIYQ